VVDIIYGREIGKVTDITMDVSKLVSLTETLNILGPTTTLVIETVNPIPILKQ
jgi:sporulation protein YlmC with PRC-barrel domain